MLEHEKHYGCIITSIISTFFADVLEVTANLQRAYKGTLKGWFGSELVILTDDLEHVVDVLNNRDMLDRGDILYKTLEPLVGKGLFSSHGNLQSVSYIRNIKHV